MAQSRGVWPLATGGERSRIVRVPPAAWCAGRRHKRSCPMGGKQLTAPTVRSRKGSGIPLVMLTAYDAPGARMAHEAGVDMILVGDSLAMVVLGYDDTLQVTVADLAHHTAAVTRGLASSAPEKASPKPFVVADLPWMSYHTTTIEA